MDTHNAGQQWEEWLGNFNCYIAASGIQDNTQKTQLLLYTVGKEVTDILKESDISNATTVAHYTDIVTKFLKASTNVVFTRYQFRLCVQSAGETINAWYQRLCEAARGCEFDTLRDSLIRDQMIACCTSDQLRRRLLQTANISLTDALQIARAFESADRQATTIESDQAATVASLTR
ncbi:MAG: hypothetical protein K0U66_10770 [Gammaproteobacteria bacterium]|nr:hypothetical protein [Gammaproteobacteria bacterium]